MSNISNQNNNHPHKLCALQPSVKVHEPEELAYAFKNAVTLQAKLAVLAKVKLYAPTEGDDSLTNLVSVVNSDEALRDAYELDLEKVGCAVCQVFEIGLRETLQDTSKTNFASFVETKLTRTIFMQELTNYLKGKTANDLKGSIIEDFESLDELLALANASDTQTEHASKILLQLSSKILLELFNQCFKRCLPQDMNAAKFASQVLNDISSGIYDMDYLFNEYEAQRSSLIFIADLKGEELEEVYDPKTVKTTYDAKLQNFQTWNALREAEARAREDGGMKLDMSQMASGYKLTKLPSQISMLYDLASLNLSNNLIREVDGNVFPGIASISRQAHERGLEQINLSKNPIRHIDKNAFKGLFALEKLDLSDAELTAIEEGTFDLTPDNHVDTVGDQTPILLDLRIGFKGLQTLPQNAFHIPTLLILELTDKEPTNNAPAFTPEHLVDPDDFDNGCHFDMYLDGIKVLNLKELIIKAAALKENPFEVDVPCRALAFKNAGLTNADIADKVFAPYGRFLQSLDLSSNPGITAIPDILKSLGENQADNLTSVLKDTEIQANFNKSVTISLEEYHQLGSAYYDNLEQNNNTNI